jgi:hypothetical protein
MAYITPKATGNRYGVAKLDGANGAADTAMRYHSRLNDLAGLTLDDTKILVSDGSGNIVAEAGNTARSRLGLGTGQSPTFTGLSLSAELAMGGAKISGLANPTGNQEAATKAYVDSQLTAQDLDFSTDSGAGAVDLDSQTMAFTSGEGLDITHSGQAITIAGEDASDSNKGIASFASADFAVSSGAVSIKSGGVSNAQMANSAVTVTAGDGLSGGGSVSLGGSVSVAVQVDDSSIETNSDTMRVKAAGITNAMLAGSIENGKLSNSTVSFGGVSLALGASDGTPAFNLSDATSYPTSSLVGTITNAQLAGSIANAKLSNSSVTMTGDSGSAQAVALGGSFKVEGTANEIETAMEAGKVKVGLPSDVTVGRDLTVTRDLVISRNLTVNGTTTTVNTSTVTIEDPLFKLSSNNTGDTVDIGMYGKYNDGSNDCYTGLVRDTDAGGKFRLFHGLQAEPTTTVNTGGTGYAKSTLIANLEGNVVGDLTGNASGNAGTATTLQTARNIAVGGDLTGSASFNGSANISIAATINDNAVDASALADNAVDAAAIVNGAVDGNKLNASVAGDGLTGGGGSALAVGAGAGLSVSANAIAINYNAGATWTGSHEFDGLVDIDGNLKTDRVFRKVRSSSSNVTLDDDHVCIAGGAITVTLPAAANGREVVVKHAAAANQVVTIATPSSETIDGGASYALDIQYSSVTLISDGTNWFIL